MSSNDVTITGKVTVEGRENGEVWVTGVDGTTGASYGHFIRAEAVAALRAHFAAERMPEDVQKRSDDQLREIARRASTGGIYSGGVKALRAVWNAALEAAYSQKVEPEPGPEYKLPGYDEVLEKIDALTIRKGVE